MLRDFGFVFLGYIDGLADAVEQGLVKAVGVSNYSGKFLEEHVNQCINPLMKFMIDI